MYAVVYKNPKLWAKYFTQKQLIFISKLFKYVSWLVGVPLSIYYGMNWKCLLFTAPLMIIGQWLNLWVYKTIGDEGVYYGWELATIQPRKIEGLPFSFHDPQYKGCVMFMVAMFLTSEATPEQIIMTIPWILSYFFSMGVENTQNRRLGTY